jgi:hypothetical protein
MVWGLVHTARHVRGVRLARRVPPLVPFNMIGMLVGQSAYSGVKGRPDRRSRNRDEVVTR